MKKKERIRDEKKSRSIPSTQQFNVLYPYNLAFDRCLIFFSLSIWTTLSWPPIRLLHINLIQSFFFFSHIGIVPFCNGSAMIARIIDLLNRYGAKESRNEYIVKSITPNKYDMCNVKQNWPHGQFSVRAMPKTTLNFGLQIEFEACIKQEDGEKKRNKWKRHPEMNRKD